MSAATSVGPALPAVTGTARRRRGRWNVPLVAGLTLFALIVLCAVCAPLLTSYDPIQQNLTDAFLAPGAKGHLLGTDALGRDVLSRLLYGARVDLKVGVLAVHLPVRDRQTARPDRRMVRRVDRRRAHAASSTWWWRSRSSCW